MIIDSFKVSVLFSLHVWNKYEEYASYVKADTRNTIYTSIQTQVIKFREGSVSRSTRIYYGEIKNKEQNLLDQ